MLVDLGLRGQQNTMDSANRVVVGFDARFSTLEEELTKVLQHVFCSTVANCSTSVVLQVDIIIQRRECGSSFLGTGGYALIDVLICTF